MLFFYNSRERAKDKQGLIMLTKLISDVEVLDSVVMGLTNFRTNFLTFSNNKIKLP